MTIRQIARTAEVTLGVVSFHGGSKEDLFKTVLARRVATLDDLRKAALAEVRARGEMTIRDVVDAYLTPYLDIASRGDPQWRAYAGSLHKSDVIVRLVRTLREHSRFQSGF